MLSLLWQRKALKQSVAPIHEKTEISSQRKISVKRR